MGTPQAWRRVAACLCFVLGACGGPASGSTPVPAASAPAPSAQTSAPTLDALVAAARQEGSLTIAWSDGPLGGAEGIPRLVEGFNQHYGLNLNAQFTPGPSMPEVAARVAQEYQAGRTSSTDAVVSYGNQILALTRVDALAPEDWTSWAPNIQDPRLVAEEGRAVVVQSSTPGITYNSARVTGADVPTRLQDLLKPQYKGRIASTPFAASFDQLAAPELWGAPRTVEYVTQLADQVAGLIRCPETQRIASGEFDVFAIDCNQGNALKAKSRGAPIEFVVASDAPLFYLMYVAIPRRAPHPHAARLWVNYLLSREAQDMAYELTFQDVHLLPGSKTAGLIEKMQAAGTRFTVGDTDFYRWNDERELARIQADLQQILRH